VLVTHDQQEAFAVADDVVVLDRGRLAQQGPPLDIYLRPASAFVGAFGGAMSVLDGHLHRGGVQLGSSHIDAAVVHVAGDISDATAVKVGLRPEWLRLATDGEAGIDVEVTQSLFLGREHEVSLRVGASQLGWRVASTLAAPTVGDRLRLVAVRACAFAS
jgi:ABC-type Fe3+/spermidine/putrescine transport system ATPase subunit